MNTSSTVARLFAFSLVAGVAGTGPAWAQAGTQQTMPDSNQGASQETSQGASQTNNGASQAAPTQGMPMRQGGMMRGMMPGMAPGRGMGGPGQGGPGQVGSGQGMGCMGQGMGAGGNMPAMMHMMHERMAHGEMGGPMGMMHFDHIEGRIAFLHAELGITDAQQSQWTAFADALRKQAQAMRGQMMHGGMPQNLPDLLTRQEQMLSARLDALKAIEGPARALYAALSPDQQKKANTRMFHHMGGM
ncbi:MAG TPA: Spy/CpxP family protein refolding chaperone [Rhodopila sp.]|nr:Spy/CpxP family protein refolding chaperone [Rhodopila sp.]